jgi:hypothetical protein
MHFCDVKHVTSLTFYIRPHHCTELRILAKGQIVALDVGMKIERIGKYIPWGFHIEHLTSQKAYCAGAAPFSDLRTV